MYFLHEYMNPDILDTYEVLYVFGELTNGSR
jgi:hypothetical protein